MQKYIIYLLLRQFILKMNKLKLFIGLFFAFPILSIAQNCSFILNGEVIDKESKNPVELAAVSIDSLQKGTYTDEKGYFEIKGLCKGVYQLSIQHLGDEAVVMDIRVDSSIHQDIYLNHAEFHLKDIQVVADKHQFGNVGSEQSVKLQTNGAGRQLAEVIENLNGVSSLSTGNSIAKPVLKGLSGNRISIISNESELNSQDWGEEHAPAANMSDYEEVELLSGTGALQYSHKANGSLIHLKSPFLSFKPFSLIAKLAYQSASQSVSAALNMQGRIKLVEGLAWKLGGDFQKAGNLKTPDYYMANTGFQRYDLSGALALHKGKWGIQSQISYNNNHLGVFEGAHIANLTDLLNVFHNGQPLNTANFTYDIVPPHQKTNHLNVQANVYSTLGNYGRLEFSHSTQIDNRKEIDEHNPEVPLLQFYLQDNQERLSFHHHTKQNKMYGTLGAQYRNMKNYYYTSYLIPDFVSNEAGVFLIEKYNIKSFEIEAGLRYDFIKRRVSRILDEPNVLQRYSGVSAALGGAYVFNPHTKLSFNMNTAWREPSVNELFSRGIHHGSARYETGNNNLIPERSYNGELAFEYHKEKKIEARLALYNNYIRNYIYLKADTAPVLTVQGAYPAFVYEQTNANILGFELYMKLNLFKDVYFANKTSLMDARNLVSGYALPLTPAQQFIYTISYEKALDRKMNSFKAAFDVKYVTQKQNVDPSDDYVATPAAYTLLGINVNTAFADDKYNVSFHIDNLLNTKYRSYLNRYRYFSDEAGINFGLNFTYLFNRNKS